MIKWILEYKKKNKGEKSMKKWMYILLRPICIQQSSHSEKERYKRNRRHTIKQLSKHKNTYLGNNSAIREILSDLPGGVIR